MFVFGVSKPLFVLGLFLMKCLINNWGLFGDIERGRYNLEVLMTAEKLAKIYLIETFHESFMLKLIPKK